MFSDSSVTGAERLGLAEPLAELWAWLFGVPFCLPAAAACLRVRTLGEPSILVLALLCEIYGLIRAAILQRQPRTPRGNEDIVRDFRETVVTCRIEVGVVRSPNEGIGKE